MSFSTLKQRALILILLLAPWFAVSPAWAQGNSEGTVRGTITDASGAVVPGAVVSIHNAISGLLRTTTTDSTGEFQFTNLPFNRYVVSTTVTGFAPFNSNVAVSSIIPVDLKIGLRVGASTQTVTVHGSSLISNDTSLQTSLDRDSFQKIPLESQSSSLSSLVTLASPGISADSNGLFHGLGDHAENSFSIDGQPITDQQSKVFSNQLPSNAVQSIQVISGAPPAEYGDKTSVVIQVTTRSGQGVTHPTGSVYTSYGSFGSATGGFDLSYGKKNWGNFVEFDGLNTGRFLDGPEFKVFHDHGNEENAFDRIDYQIDPLDSVHLNLNYSRSWFQTPNSYDNLNVYNVISGGSGPNPVSGDVGNADQRSKIGTFNIAPSYTRILSNNAVFNIGAFARKDAYYYYPSGNPLADLGPPNLQRETVSQQRTLLNTGLHSDLTYTHGINTIKMGAMYEQTLLREHFELGIVDPTLNSPCTDADGNPIAGYTDPSQCAGADMANAGFDSNLLPYDLTRGGSDYYFYGHTDVKETALYLEDQIKVGNWFFNAGIRGDMYNGLTVARQAEPRLSAAYSINRTHTVLRGSYARVMETPFNENLVLSSQGCSNDVLSPLLLCTSTTNAPLSPGLRNEYHAGLEQSFGKYIVVSGDYIWKYTQRAFDFSVLGNTPITFPIEWTKSKIPGFAMRADLAPWHNLSAYTVMSSVAARFFPPQVGGAGATVGQTGYAFRIDHDEKYNNTTHFQYQIPIKFAPWIGFNMRYDSGLVAGAVPCYNPYANDANTSCLTTSTTLNGQPAVDLSSLTADQEFEAGMKCDGVAATPYQALPSVCPANELTSNLVKIPAPGTGDNDHNPPRIQPRTLFDLSIGDDNLFHGSKYRWSAQLTGINITNKYALYNFLSTFSGTHYVTPRALTAQVGFHF